jgi:hypothetical protein
MKHRDIRGEFFTKSPMAIKKLIQISAIGILAQKLESFLLQLFFCELVVA